MPKARVFISSTMEDMVEEREAVVREIERHNYLEAVHAENWLPNGMMVWDKIEEELNTCHIFVLLVGERYGWIPTKGPGAGEGFSVTHMEFNKAKEIPLPILPFVKKLDPKKKRAVKDAKAAKDAKKRTKFLDEVAGWDKGRWRQEYTDIKKLAKKVDSACMNVLMAKALREEVERRSRQISEEREAFVSSIDESLIHFVRQREAVLLAGSGISLAAGFPSARDMSEVFIEQMRKEKYLGRIPPATSPFQRIAGIFEAEYGREKLLDLFLHIINAPQGVEPTEAHRISVKLFRTILTTNQDTLFEAACKEAKVPYTVIDDDRPIPKMSERRVIVKIDGSIAAPARMLLTEHDFLEREKKKPRLWKSLSRTLRTSPLVVVGSSLRDPSLNIAVHARDEHLPGYIVSPFDKLLDDVQTQGFKLNPILTDADTFFRSLKRLTAS